jgi:hypothetical protein
MKITRINLRLLRNEEWFNFFTEFKTFVEETTPEALDIVALYATFLVMYGLADELLEVSRKSDYSAVIIDLDSSRDETFRGADLAVQSATHHFDPVRKEAGNTLAEVFAFYGNVASRPYNEETSKLVNFIQDLRGKYAPAVQILGLTEWVDELERRNNAFEAAVLGRNRESAGKPDDRLPDLRLRMNECFANMANRIDAKLLLQGDERLESFAKLLNANVERYQLAVNRRRGKKPAKNEELTINN